MRGGSHSLFVLEPARHEFPEISTSEDIHEVSNLAFQGDRQPNDHRERWHLETTFHLADVRVCRSRPLGERSLTLAAFLAQLPQSGAE